MGHREQTLDQKRALDSLNKVKKIQGFKDEKLADDYATYVVKLPVEILTNGLGQALAQLLATAKQKKEDPHYWLYEDVQSWLCRNEEEAPYRGEKSLLDALLASNQNQYKRALHEVMAWLDWHKKITVAYLKKTEGVRQNENSTV